MDVIRGEHMSVIKDEVILCNIGHFDSEIMFSSLTFPPPRSPACAGHGRARPMQPAHAGFL